MSATPMSATAIKLATPPMTKTVYSDRTGRPITVPDTFNEEYATYNRCRGHRHLERIATKMDQLVELCRAFADEHTDECSCPLCTHPSTADVSEDVLGASWALEQALSVFRMI